MGLRFKSKSEEDYYKKWLEKSRSKKFAEMQVRYLRKTNNKIRVSIKRKFPTLRIKYK